MGIPNVNPPGVTPEEELTVVAEQPVVVEQPPEPPKEQSVEDGTFELSEVARAAPPCMWKIDIDDTTGEITATSYLTNEKFVGSMEDFNKLIHPLD